MGTQVRFRRLLPILWLAALISIVCLLLAPAQSGDAHAPSQPRIVSDRDFVAVVLPSPTASLAPTPAPSHPSGLRLRGVASWYASWCNCTAMRQWQGHTVLVVGPAGHAYVRINDYGPIRSTHRIIDLNPGTFTTVCRALGLGTCTVTVTLVH